MEEKQEFEKYPELAAILIAVASHGFSYLNNSNWTYLLQQINGALIQSNSSPMVPKQIADKLAEALESLYNLYYVDEDVANKAKAALESYKNSNQ